MCVFFLTNETRKAEDRRRSTQNFKTYNRQASIRYKLLFQRPLTFQSASAAHSETYRWNRRRIDDVFSSYRSLPGLTQHLDHATRGSGAGGAQARGVSAVGRARGPGRVAFRLVQLEPDEYVQDDDERPRGQEEQHRRQFERVRQLVGQTAGGQLGHDGPVRVLRVHQSHLDGL